MAVECRILGRGDADALLNVAPGVFDNAVNPKLAAEFLNDPRHHLVVAIDSGQIVGFASAVHYVHPDKPAELWINEVGVSPEHRQQGVGRQVLDAILNLGRDMGCAVAWVLTDSSNAAALRLYESAGGTAAAAPSIMFEFTLQSKAPHAA